MDTVASSAAHQGEEESLRAYVASEWDSDRRGPQWAQEVRFSPVVLLVEAEWSPLRTRNSIMGVRLSHASCPYLLSHKARRHSGRLGHSNC